MDNLEQKSTALKKYKFQNVPLEKTIIYLLELYGYPSNIIYNKAMETTIAEVAIMLVNYKFNSHLYTFNEFLIILDKWFIENELILNPYADLLNFKTW